MRIVILSTPTDYRIHGSLSRSIHNQLRRKIGPCTLANCDYVGGSWQGMAKDSKGLWWDWTVYNGEVIVALSQ